MTCEEPATPRLAMALRALRREFSIFRPKRRSEVSAGLIQRVTIKGRAYAAVALRSLLLAWLVAGNVIWDGQRLGVTAGGQAMGCKLGDTQMVTESRLPLLSQSMAASPPTALEMALTKLEEDTVLLSLGRMPAWARAWFTENLLRRFSASSKKAFWSGTKVLL